MSSSLKAGLLAVCTMLLFVSCYLRAELVPVPALQKRVTDLTATLTLEQQSQLEAKLAAFEQQKGSQIAVLIIPTTQPEVIEQYSIRVTDVWKLGREKPDDGLLLLVAKDDRKMRIEVGRGLEGVIPDLIAKRIISEILAPHFRQGDYYGGISVAIDKIIALVSGEQLPAPAAVSDQDGVSWENLLPLLFIGSVMLGGLLRAMFGDFLGGVLSGGAIGALAWMLGGGILMAILFGIVAFVLTLIGPSGFGHIGGLGGMGGGGYGGHRGGSSGWSGGGGSFGGGGASGGW